MQSTSIIRRWIRGSLLITVLVLVLAEGLFLYYSYNDLYGGVERAVLGSGHQPGDGVVGHAVAWPMFERGDQRVLRQLFGQTHVVHDARDAADDLGRLEAPDGIDALTNGLRHSR